jgi:hypothetical protein
MVIHLGSAAAVTALEFLSNSRGRRNARAHRHADFGSNEPAFVLCENNALFFQRNQQYLKAEFA